MTSKSLWEEIRPHLPSLSRAAMRWTRNQSAADDVVQETLVRALEKRAELRDPAGMRGWLMAIEKTVFLNGRRGAAAKREVLAGQAVIDDRGPRGDLEREVLSRSFDEATMAALAALPEVFRDALWLREVEGLSYEEIATIHECPTGTVRSRLARARESMRASIVRAGPDARESGDTNANAGEPTNQWAVLEDGKGVTR
jgi:RNA polymerase sigma-70 factor (ECF subfamily)